MGGLVRLRNGWRPRPRLSPLFFCNPLVRIVGSAMLVIDSSPLMARFGNLPGSATFVAVLVFILGLGTGCGDPEDVFELGAQQSMLITGKGVGQDAAFNPFAGSACFAVVENLSDNPFEARVVDPDGSTSTPVEGRQSLRIPLEAKSQLILDTVVSAKARVRFEKRNEASD